MAFLPWNVASGTLRKLLNKLHALLSGKMDEIAGLPLSALWPLGPSSAIAWARNSHAESRPPPASRCSRGVGGIARHTGVGAVPESDCIGHRAGVGSAAGCPVHAGPRGQHPVAAFFFDLITQQGSMRGVPALAEAMATAAMATAATRARVCVPMALQPKPGSYAAAASRFGAGEAGKAGVCVGLVQPPGTIACRHGMAWHGVVHGATVELTVLLD